jgi:hypothetical protein
MLTQWSNPVRSLGTTRMAPMLVAIMAGLAAVSWSAAARAEVLLDEAWADGSRAETKLPAEAAVWVGRDEDVTVSKGLLSTKMGDMSQKMWVYFTPSEPVTLAVGQTLTASLSFIPRGALYENASRGFRVGLFHDPTSPRIEKDTSDDGGGTGDPWSDATGYAVQFLLTSDEYTGTAPFDLGKRTELTNPSLLGTSSVFTKTSGGMRVNESPDKEYTLTLTVKKVSDTQVDATTTLSQGSETLATATVHDNGVQLGGKPIADKFDMLYIRLSDSMTTADQIDFTRFKVTVEP